jgi:DNA-directed RNA polymerase alpha subunit
MVTARVGEFDSYSRSETYITSVPQIVDMSPLLKRHRLVQKATVGIRFDANIALNGDYLVRLTLSRKEIARLFFLQYADCTIEDLSQLFQELRHEVETGAVEERPAFSPAMFKRIDELAFWPQVASSLKKLNIVCIGDLVQKTDERILRGPYFGHKALNHVKEVLASMGLHLGMEVQGWTAFDPVMLKKVDELDLSFGLALKNNNIIYVGDLVQNTETDLSRNLYLGRTKLEEIEEALAPMGLCLGMEVQGWPSKHVEILAKLFKDADAESTAES